VTVGYWYGSHIMAKSREARAQQVYASDLALARAIAAAQELPAKDWQKRMAEVQGGGNDGGATWLEWPGEPHEVMLLSRDGGADPTPGRQDWPSWDELSKAAEGPLPGPEDSAYLGSYTSFSAGGTPWKALVRQRRDAAMKPVTIVEDWVIFSSLFSLAGSVVLLVALWAVLIWLLRREERRRHA
jgi:hypothetical protein